MTPEQRIERARLANLIVTNPAYKEAHEKLTLDIRALRLSLPPGDVERAYRLVLMEQVVEKAKRLMLAYLEDADAARKELTKEEYPGPVGRIVNKFRRV